MEQDIALELCKRQNPKQRQSRVRKTLKSIPFKQSSILYDVMELQALRYSTFSSPYWYTRRLRRSVGMTKHLSMLNQHWISSNRAYCSIKAKRVNSLERWSKNVTEDYATGPGPRGPTDRACSPWLNQHRGYNALASSLVTARVFLQTQSLLSLIERILGSA